MYLAYPAVITTKHKPNTPSVSPRLSMENLDQHSINPISIWAVWHADCGERYQFTWIKNLPHVLKTPLGGLPVFLERIPRVRSGEIVCVLACSRSRRPMGSLDNRSTKSLPLRFARS